jgi:hypothetical protein
MTAYLTLALFILALAPTLAPTLALAADPASVDLFESMKAGDLEARFIPKNAAAGTVILTNKTDQPLHIKLPEAFAGVPVLAQVRPPIFNPGNANNGANNGAANQSVGASFPGMNQGIGQGNGIFSIDAGRARKLKVVSVCLDFGNPDPNPRIPYELVPLAHRTTDPQLADLVKALGRGHLDQPVAQAAAWHLSNHLSWSDLAAKSRTTHIGGSPEPLFTPAQLTRALHFLESSSRLNTKPLALTSYGGE